MIPTQNYSGIGDVWNPFTANFSDNYKEYLKNKKIRKQKAKLTLCLLLSVAYSV